MERRRTLELVVGVAKPACTDGGAGDGNAEGAGHEAGDGGVGEGAYVEAAKKGGRDMAETRSDWAGRCKLAVDGPGEFACEVSRHGRWDKEDAVIK